MHLNEKCHRLIGSKLLDEGYFINRVHMLAYRNLTAFSFFSHNHHLQRLNN